MNPLAQELNQIIDRESPAVGRLLSDRGKRLFFPRGILSQSQEAKEKAHWINATIGIATDGSEPLYLPCIHKYFNNLPPKEIYPYAPAAGRKDLREAWLGKMREENPSMGHKPVSLPVVTSALTHGLSLLGDLFVDEGDTILLPHMYWGNYNLIFGVRLGAQIATYPLYAAAGGFNTDALRDALNERPRDSKTIVLVNTPNNPTGYSPGREEAETIAAVLLEAARSRDLLVITDDAYFGLFYEDRCLTESIFGLVCDGHDRLLAAKGDAATKEEFVWGFRCGFLTYGVKNGTPALYEALEKKTAGAIRGGISNSPHVSQTLVLRALEDPDFRAEQKALRDTLAERARAVQQVVGRAAFRDFWDVYPFNAGYFMCLHVKGVEAEALRVHLLDRYGLGTIATGASDLRIAFSSVPLATVEAVFETIARGIGELRDS